MESAAIGIFDSGLGGLTVAREIARALPHESLVYLGDTARCPYGPRDLTEVRQFGDGVVYLAPEPVGAPTMRPPAYMSYPAFMEPHWRWT